MKTQLKTVNDHGSLYEALIFWCPGCVELCGKDSGLHMLPVNSLIKTPSWGWNNSFDKPTLTPSILSRFNNDQICHSFLKDGIFQFLGDCTHSLANQMIPISDLPDWVIEK